MYVYNIIYISNESTKRRKGEEKMERACNATPKVDLVPRGFVRDASSPINAGSLATPPISLTPRATGTPSTIDEPDYFRWLWSRFCQPPIHHRSNLPVRRAKR